MHGRTGILTLKIGCSELYSIMAIAISAVARVDYELILFTAPATQFWTWTDDLIVASSEGQLSTFPCAISVSTRALWAPVKGTLPCAATRSASLDSMPIDRYKEYSAK